MRDGTVYLVTVKTKKSETNLTCTGDRAAAGFVFDKAAKKSREEITDIYLRQIDGSKKITLGSVRVTPKQ